MKRLLRIEDAGGLISGISITQHEALMKEIDTTDADVVKLVELALKNAIARDELFAFIEEMNEKYRDSA
jgi:hypothetical protein